VDNFPGVTRDRNYGNVRRDGVEFTLIDTGGFTGENDDDFSHHIRFQINLAIEDADVILLMLDGKNGVSPFDTDLVGMLRTVTKPVFLCG